MTYSVIEINEPGSEPYWTLVEEPMGQDGRNVWRFPSRAIADAEAARLNDQIPEGEE